MSRMNIRYYKAHPSMNTKLDYEYTIQQLLESPVFQEASKNITETVVKMYNGIKTWVDDVIESVGEENIQLMLEHPIETCMCMQDIFADRIPCIRIDKNEQTTTDHE